MTQPTRARVDAILDVGLEHAPADELAWLAAERGRDAALDAEVGALLDVQRRLVSWGGHMGAADAALGSVEGALAGIFDGLDAGLYDDGLELDAAPQFDDEDHVVVGLGARPVAVGAAAAAAPAGRRPGPVLRFLRDNRVAQVLAAAAAVTVVVTAGLTAVQQSAPGADEAQMAPAAAAPAQAVSDEAPTAPSSAVAPTTVAPAAPRDALAAAPEPQSPSGSQAFADAPQGRRELEEAPVQEGIGGYGGPLGDRSDDQLGASSGRSRAPHAEVLRPASPVAQAANSSSTARPSVGSAARPSGATEFEDALMPGESAAPGTYQASQSRGAAARNATGGAAGTAPAAVPQPSPVAADPAPRYRTWAALRPVLNACLQGGHDATVEIARSTGAVRVVSAPSASPAELRCLQDAVRQSAIAPPPSVTRQLRVSRPAPAAVSDTPTQ